MANELSGFQVSILMEDEVLINIEGIEGKQLQISGDAPVTINQLLFEAKMRIF